MREIKFRGWSTYENKWVYGYLTVRFNTRSDEKHYFIYSASGMSGWRVDPESVGQYTGLKDSKGVEIYEGDIIEYKNQHHSVVYDQYFCKFQLLEEFLRPQLDVKQYANICEINCTGYKIVGNNLENKELLK